LYTVWTGSFTSFSNSAAAYIWI